MREPYCSFFKKEKDKARPQPLTEAEILLLNFTPSENVSGYISDEKGNCTYRPSHRRRVAE